MSIITVKNTNGVSKVINLNKDIILSDLRKDLIKRGVMGEADYFLFDNAKLDKDDESQITLNDFLDGGKAIAVGVIVKSISATTMEEFLQKSIDEKLSFYSAHQLTRGLVFGESGIERTFHDLFTFKHEPVISKKITNTEITSTYSFSEVSMKIHLLTSSKSSVALKNEYIDAKAEYEQTKSNDQSKNTVNEYLISKYMIHQAEFKINESDLELNMDFFKAIKKVIEDDDEEDMRKTAKLVQVLNEWGFYIPLTFKMGGLLYTTDSKTVTSYEQALKNQQDFSAEASATFGKSSASAEASVSTDSSNQSATKNEFKNLQVRQIGGKAGCTKADNDFAKSLENINTWEITEITNFYPSLLLLKDVYIDGKKSDIFMDSLRLLNEYHYVSALNKIQPYINIYRYATDIEKELNKE